MADVKATPGQHQSTCSRARRWFRANIILCGHGVWVHNRSYNIKSWKYSPSPEIRTVEGTRVKCIVPIGMGWREVRVRVWIETGHRVCVMEHVCIMWWLGDIGCWRRISSTVALLDGSCVRDAEYKEKEKQKCHWMAFECVLNGKWAPFFSGACVCSSRVIKLRSKLSVLQPDPSNVHCELFRFCERSQFLFGSCFYGFFGWKMF